MGSFDVLLALDDGPFDVKLGCPKNCSAPPFDYSIVKRYLFVASTLPATNTSAEGLHIGIGLVCVYFGGGPENIVTIF